MAEQGKDAPASLGMAVLTVSDTRTAANDASGDYLAAQLQAAGHRLVARALSGDDVYHIRARLSAWAVDPQVQVILTTGGTGLAPRDRTPEAVRALLDRDIAGFGELFRTLSYQELGSATVQSRALGGVVNGRLVFCLPGSTAACRTAWEGILRTQLDSRQRPCNFVQILFTSR